MNTWYSYDPETGFETFSTPEEAEKDAEEALDRHRERAPDGWSESVTEVAWGLLVPYGETHECDRKEAPEGSEFDCICDYRLHSVRDEDPLETACRRLERNTDWYQQRFNRLRKWVEEEVRPLSEETAGRYYDICANGTAPHEQADWRETMHGLRLRAEQAERARDEALSAEHTAAKSTQWLLEAFNRLAGPRLLAEQDVISAARELASWDWLSLLAHERAADDVREGAKRLDCALFALDKAKEAAMFNLGRAIEEMRAGRRVARRGWNGKGMYLCYQRGYPDGIPINRNTSEATGIPEGTVCRFDPYIMMRTASGSFIPWLCSQADLLADDWEVVS